MKPSEVLDKAREIMEPAPHYQGSLTDIGYCPLLAISKAAPLPYDNGEAWEAIIALSDYLKEHIGHGQIATWNDSTPKAEVTDTMRIVARKLRGQGQ